MDEDPKYISDKGKLILILVVFAVMTSLFLIENWALITESNNDDAQTEMEEKFN